MRIWVIETRIRGCKKSERWLPSTMRRTFDFKYEAVAEAQRLNVSESFEHRAVPYIRKETDRNG